MITRHKKENPNEYKLLDAAGPQNRIGEETHGTMTRARATLTRDEAEEMLAILSAYFDIPKPTLVWRERVRNGRASWKNNAIMCGHLAWRGPVNSMLHEFAHILHFRRIKGIPKKHHGAEFVQALWDTAQAWLGDATKYDWSTEYVSVKSAGRKKGA